jgi:histidine phosphotransfer protein HptB
MSKRTLPRNAAHVAALPSTAPAGGASPTAGDWPDVIGNGPAELHTMLIESARADLQDAYDALHTGNFVRAAFVAHRMKATARLLGARDTLAACAALETQCRQRNADHAGDLLATMKSGFAAAYGKLGGKHSARSDDPDR